MGEDYNYHFIVPGKPKPKERPRLTRRGRTYTPKATLDYEHHVRESYHGPLFVGPVVVTMDLHPTHAEVTVQHARYTSTLRGDIDNYVKSILDGLTGVAYDNDRQVVNVHAVKA